MGAMEMETCVDKFVKKLGYDAQHGNEILAPGTNGIKEELFKKITDGKHQGMLTCGWDYYNRQKRLEMQKREKQWSGDHEKLRGERAQGIYESIVQKETVEIFPELVKDTKSSDKEKLNES